MKIITAPQETALYPGLVASTIMEVRMKLGMSRIQLNYREIINQNVPILVIDCFNDKGKLYTLRCHQTHRSGQNGEYPCCCIFCEKTWTLPVMPLRE